MFTTSDLHSWTAPLVMHCLELSKRKNFGSKNLFLKYFLKTFIFTELYFIVKFEFSHHAPKLAIQKKCFVPRFLIWGYVQNQNYIFSCSTPSQPITDFKKNFKRLYNCKNCKKGAFLNTEILIF